MRDVQFGEQERVEIVRLIHDWPQSPILDLEIHPSGPCGDGYRCLAYRT